MGGLFGTNRLQHGKLSEWFGLFTGKVIVKLSPNVTDITEFARIAEDEGADSVSLINTAGMSLDIEKVKPSLSTFTEACQVPQSSQ